MHLCTVTGLATTTKTLHAAEQLPGQHRCPARARPLKKGRGTKACPEGDALRQQQGHCRNAAYAIKCWTNVLRQEL